MVRELLNLILSGLQPLKACLIAPTHVVQILSLLIVKGLVAIKEVLEEVWGNVKEVLSLEEVCLGEAY